MKPRKRKKCPKCKGCLNLIGECPLCLMFATGETPGGHLPSCWPLKSKALAVHRSQVAAANERNRKHGVAARYEADGTCVLPDRGARRDVIKLEREFLGKSLGDMNGGYGDG